MILTKKFEWDKGCYCYHIDVPFSIYVPDVRMYTTLVL